MHFPIFARTRGAPLAMKYAPKRYPRADAGRRRDVLQQYGTSLHRLERQPQPNAPVAAFACIGGITDIPVL